MWGSEALLPSSDSSGKVLGQKIAPLKSLDWVLGLTLSTKAPTQPEL